MPNQLTLTLFNMKNIIIILSLFFVSCQTKTKTDIEYEKIQKWIDSARYDHSLPSLPVVDSLDIDLGASESSCLK